MYFFFNFCKSNCIACWEEIWSVYSSRVDHMAVNLNILPLVDFQTGVVYLSPKPHQIRMELYHLKHSKLASDAVKSDAIKSELSVSLFTSWRYEVGLHFKRLMGIKWSLLLYFIHVITRFFAFWTVYLLCNWPDCPVSLLFFGYFQGYKKTVQRSVQRRKENVG